MISTHCRATSAPDTFCSRLIPGICEGCSENFAKIWRRILETVVEVVLAPHGKLLVDRALTSIEIVDDDLLAGDRETCSEFDAWDEFQVDPSIGPFVLSASRPQIILNFDRRSSWNAVRNVDVNIPCELPNMLGLSLQ